MPESHLYLIAGLGNPGKEYSQTRHNIGFMVVEELAQRYKLTFNSSKFNAEITKGVIEGKHTILVKPQLYMNKSGYPIQAISSYYKIETNNIIIVHDEMDIQFGRIMIVKDRGHGGHNGIRSVIEALGTKEFCRIRVGIGRSSKTNNEQQDTTVDYVLGKFSANEKQEIDSIINATINACVIVITKGHQTAMNSCNSYNPLNI